MCTVAAAAAATSMLKEMQDDLSALKRMRTASRPSWWDSAGKHLTAYDIHSRWGIWPTAILRVLRICDVAAASCVTVAEWGNLWPIEEVKHICHALEYLVHGK